MPVIAAVWQDLRYGARALRRSPAFAALAILTMAVGIGASAAVFSVVDAVLLRPLPFPHPDELVAISQMDRRTGEVSHSTTPANFLDWRQRARSFTAIAAYREDSVALAAGDAFPEGRRAAMVSANFFETLRVQAARGRVFTAGDDGPNAAPVAIIADSLWRERFGGAPDVIGRTIRLNDEPYTIVGVLRPGLDYPGRAEIWIAPHWPVPDDPLVPVTQDPSTQRGHDYFQAIGRLKPGVSIEAARGDMDTVARSLERDYPNADLNVAAAVLPLRDEVVVADVRSTTVILFAAVGLLLLISTANVSGLLLARASARQAEIAVRAALGASRARIVSQLLTESVLLALLGGSAGVLLAMWLVPAIVALSPVDLGMAGAVAVNRSVLLFGLTVSAGCGVLFGLAPATRSAGRQACPPAAALKGRTTAGGPGSRGAVHRQTRGILVVAEIALSLVLVVASGLTVRSLVRLQQVPLGFEPAGVVTFRIAPSPARYPTQAQRAVFWERTLEAVAGVPGIDAAAAVSRLPLTPGNSGRGLTIAGVAPDVSANVDYRTVSPSYFRVMGIPLLQGRDVDAADREDRARVAIVTRSAADRFWPGRDPLGRTFKINDPGPDYTVVGVVGDIRAFSLARSPRPMVYVPYRQDAFPFMTFLVRSAEASRSGGGQWSASLQASVRRAIASVDKDQPIGEPVTMEQQIAGSLSRRRFSVTLLTGFGAAAMLLAAVGLYGVLAFLVAQRRREIGVRIALGATARDIVRTVVGEGMRLAAAGIASGAVLSIAATRVMGSMLFGTSPTDAATFAGATAILALTAAVASVVPALRACRVDPLLALRDE